MDDRVGQAAFTMTHESLALMLGVRRQTVSAAASDMSERGWIVYRRGLVTVVDRAGLEDAACECYETLRHELLRVVGPPIPRGREDTVA
jgi:Mn-dependent DtxR family transcriptional regulator